MYCVYKGLAKKEREPGPVHCSLSLEVLLIFIAIACIRRYLQKDQRMNWLILQSGHPNALYIYTLNWLGILFLHSFYKTGIQRISKTPEVNQYHVGFHKALEISKKKKVGGGVGRILSRINVLYCSAFTAKWVQFMQPVSEVGADVFVITYFRKRLPLLFLQKGSRTAM